MKQVYVIKGGTGLCGTQAFAVELDCRIDGLLALYQPQCAVPLNREAFTFQLSDYIIGGGHIHMVIDENGVVLGWASILINPFNQLLEHAYLVQRIIIGDQLSPEDQRETAKLLIESLIKESDATLELRCDDLWIMVTIPDAALEPTHPLFGELESAGFRGSVKSGLANFVLWRKQSERQKTSTA